MSEKEKGAARTRGEQDQAKRECGNTAAMREALEAVLELLWHIQNGLRSPISNQAYAVKRKIKAALAAPPRNCDIQFVVDGPADRDADKAWLVFRRRNPDVYFDVSGLLRCIDWLLAPATEKERGAK